MGRFDYLESDDPDEGFESDFDSDLVSDFELLLSEDFSEEDVRACFSALAASL